MPPVDIGISLAEMRVIEPIILTASFLALWTGLLICACCGRNNSEKQRQAAKIAATNAVVEEPPPRIKSRRKDTSRTSSLESRQLQKSKKEKASSDPWAHVEPAPMERGRRPIMPMTSDMMLLPENQQYMHSWSVVTGTETGSCTVSMASAPTGSGHRSPAGGLKVVRVHKIGQCRLKTSKKP